jgi:predicted GNAT family acetyltransferase
MMSEQEAIVTYRCTQKTFRPVPHDPVRWLDPERDLTLMQRSWGAVGIQISREDLEEWTAQGYRFCAVVEEGRIVSKAARWAYSDTVWELAGVHTEETHRQRGYGKMVCSCVTAHILAHVGQATCHARASNISMRRLAESVGFVLE